MVWRLAGGEETQAGWGGTSETVRWARHSSPITSHDGTKMGPGWGWVYWRALLRPLVVSNFRLNRIPSTCHYGVMTGKTDH